MKDFWDTHKHLWILSFLAVYLIGFILVEHVVSPADSYFVCYWPLIDDAIPFCEWFALPYITWYPYMAAVGLYIGFHKDAGLEFTRIFVFVIGGMCLCLLIYFLFPNGQNLRPEAFPRDNPLTSLISGLYQADTNTNVLPSMHVYASLAIYSAAAKSKYPLFKKRYVRLILLVLCILISISTVFIKQHSVLDCIAAVILFIPMYFLMFGPFTRFLEKKFQNS